MPTAGPNPSELLKERSARLAHALERFEAESSADFERAADMMHDVARGATLFVCGNGGSAAQAMHVEAELVGRYRSDRRPLRSVYLALGASTSTAISNDFGGDEMFARPLAALAGEGDVLLAISTSGGSANVLAALRAARDAGLRTILLTGPNASADAADAVLAVPGDTTDAIQDGHQLVIHALMDVVEAAIA